MTVTRERLQEALHSVAYEHDTETAVWALMAEVWEEGRITAFPPEQGLRGARAEDNPYAMSGDTT